MLILGWKRCCAVIAAGEPYELRGTYLCFQGYVRIKKKNKSLILSALHCDDWIGSREALCTVQGKPVLC